MGMPLWMGNKHGIRWRVVLLKCMRSLSWKTFRCHTVSHGAGRMQMPPSLSINHSQTLRKDGIYSRNRHIYGERVKIFHPGVFMCNRFWQNFYQYTYCDASVYVCVCVCLLIWCVTVTRAKIEYMLLDTARKTKWWMILMQGRPKQKQTGCLTVCQQTNSLYEPFLRWMQWQRQTQRKSNYSISNLNWPSSAILHKSNTLIEMFLSQMNTKDEKKHGVTSMHWQAFIIAQQKEITALGSNKGSDEKSVIQRHYPTTGSGQHLFTANGVESSVIIISTKGLKSTWWMLIRPISTTLSLHRCLKRSSLLWRFCTTAGANTTFPLKCQHAALWIKTGYCFWVDG